MRPFFWPQIPSLYPTTTIPSTHTLMLSVSSSLDPLKSSTNMWSIARTWYDSLPSPFSGSQILGRQDMLGSFLAKRPAEVNASL